ncbi:hypothetical protein [Alteromonas halophila]|uniref:Uncharacterized protein n=1 Tax=Alteromonas halophila TaxID=516698 RepID=A0A918N0F8_9ALTE|nr:hypothetical protein [Alteromonas halophila]GGW89315.1 hypothetical protein GCM10007391_24430 [Alteromonas halophila]
MVSLLLASGISLAAIASLYRSWRQQAPAFLYLSIALFIVSCVLWSYSQGWEFGLVYALCLPGLLVWPFIGLNQSRLPAPKNQPSPRQIKVTARQTATHLGHTLVALPGLMITSLLTAMAFSLRLPFADTGQLATGVVLQPLLWGLLAYHYFATGAKGKALLIYLSLSVISTLLLLYLPGLN